MKKVDKVHDELSRRASTQNNLSSLVLDRNQSRSDRKQAFMSAVLEANNRYQASIHKSNKTSDTEAVCA